MQEFIIFTVLIYGFLLLAYGVKKQYPSLSRFSKGISKGSLLFVQAPALLFVYWSVEKAEFLSQFGLALLPLLLSLVMGGAGYIISLRLYSGNLSRGAFTISSMISNNAFTLGGFICLLLLGTQGLQYAQIYNLLMLPYIVTVIFFLARVFRDKADGKKTKGSSHTVRALGDPFILVPVLSISAGILLMGLEIPFPSGLNLPMRLLVAMAVGGYSVSFGLTLSFRSIGRGWKRLLLIFPVKFMVGPLAGVLLALLMGFGPEENPLAFKVVVIQSAMPTAILAVVVSKLYELDDVLATNIWILTTSFIILLFPLFQWVAG
jgi:hypothetical protein